MYLDFLPWLFLLDSTVLEYFIAVYRNLCSFLQWHYISLCSYTKAILLIQLVSYWWISKFPIFCSYSCLLIGFLCVCECNLGMISSSGSKGKCICNFISYCQTPSFGVITFIAFPAAIFESPSSLTSQICCQIFRLLPKWCEKWHFSMG